MNNQATQQTLASFIEHNHVSLSYEQTDSNPCMDDSANMDHYKCVLRAGRSRMTVYYSKGYGHNGAEPQADEVLDCLASDASGYENAQGFEGWCSDFGYSADSRKAEKTYHTVEKQAKKLKALLGDSAYKALLWDTERL